jgi:hypothetical protein
MSSSFNASLQSQLADFLHSLRVAGNVALIMLQAPLRHPLFDMTE